MVQMMHDTILHGMGTFLFLIESALLADGSNQGEKLHEVITFKTHTSLVVTVLNVISQQIPASVRTRSFQLGGASENWSSVVLTYPQLLVRCGRFDEAGILSESTCDVFELSVV